MGRQVSAILIVLAFLGSIVAGCSSQEKPEDVANATNATGGKGAGATKAPEGTPPAGPNPNLTPEQIENRAGSALGGK